MFRPVMGFLKYDLRRTLGSNPVGILTGVGVIVVALVVIVGVTLVADNAAESRRDELAREVEPFAADLAGFNGGLLELSADLRAYVLTEDSIYRERYVARRSALTNDLNALRDSGEAAGFGLQSQSIAEDALSFLAASDLAFQAAKRGDPAEAGLIIEQDNTPRLDTVSASIDSAGVSVREEIARLRDRIHDIDAVEQYTQLLAGGLGIIAAGVLVWLALSNQRLLSSADADRARFLSMMTSLSRHGICQIDSGGRIEYCNPAADEMLGYGTDELAGRSLHDVAHYQRADGSPCLRKDCPLEKGLISGRSYKAQESFVRQDHTFLPVDITSEPIILHGRRSGAVIVFEDVTQRQRQELFRQQFLSFASHELRTPLMIIGGFAQMLQKKAKAAPDLYDEASHEAIEELVEGAVRMRRITETVLDLTRVQSGSGLALEADTVDMRELLDKEVAALKAKHPEVRVSTVYPSGPLVLESDEARVRQVVLNLLDNAAKYGGEPPEVALSVGTDDSRLTVSVRDNGRGIAQEDQPLVFEQFYRGATAADKGGLGVGLFISKRIVDRLGGTLTFQSADGEGTEFILTLPLTTPSADGSPGR